MIDTDKYEGHYTDDFARFWVTADDELNADIERANATTKLIYDAPLLLEEVKELQAWYKLMVRVVNDLRSDLTMMRLDDNHQPQFEVAVRAATKTLSVVIDVD